MVYEKEYSARPLYFVWAARTWPVLSSPIGLPWNVPRQLSVGAPPRDDTQEFISTRSSRCEQQPTSWPTSLLRGGCLCACVQSKAGRGIAR